MAGKSVILKIAVEPYESDNPYVGLFTKALVNIGAEVVPLRYSLQFLREQDVVIIHFPTLFMGGDDFRSAWRVFVRLLLARMLYRVKLVWVAHNVTSHDRRRTPFRTAMFLAILNGIIYLSQHSRSIIRKEYSISSRVRELITVHGAYPGVRPPSLVLLKSRTPRLLSFGFVRPYKGWDELISAVAKVKLPVALVLVGKVLDAEYADRLSLAASRSECVTVNFRDDLLTTAELEQEIDNAAGIVLPYRKILNSGAAIHALSRYRPVLVPSIGSMPELAESIGHTWVGLFNGDISPSHVEAFLGQIDALRDSKPDLSAYSWTRVSADLRRWLVEL